MRRLHLRAFALLLALGLCLPCAAQEQILSAKQLYGIALRAMQQDNMKQAKAALTMLILQYPGDERQGLAHLVLAQVYLKESDFFAAKFTLERIVAEFADAKDRHGKPIMPSALTYLAALYSSMKREDDARRLYHRIQKEFPDAVDDSGEKFVTAVPEQYRIGYRPPSAPGKPAAPDKAAATDDGTKRKIYQQYKQLMDRARGEAMTQFPASLAKRREHVAKKAAIARKALAIRFKISAEEVEAVAEEGKAQGW